MAFGIAGVGAKKFQDSVSLSPLLGYAFLCVASVLRQALPIASKMAARSSGTIFYLFSNPVKTRVSCPGWYGSVGCSVLPYTERLWVLFLVRAHT